MANILAQIAAYKREEIAAAKRRRPRAALEKEAKAAGAPRGFLAAIERRLAVGGLTAGQGDDLPGGVPLAGAPTLWRRTENAAWRRSRTSAGQAIGPRAGIV